MTTPVAVLVGFAGWTLATLMVPIGWYRWRLILSGRAGINEFERDSIHNTGWYQRALRAHANCLENLPLYTVLVVAMIVTGATHPALDTLALVLLAARIAQTATHVGFEMTRRMV